MGSPSTSATDTAATIRGRVLTQIQTGDFAGMAQSVRLGLSSVPHFADGIQAALAQRLPLAAPWRDIARLMPPAWNMLASAGWLRSLSEGRPVDAGGMPIPWLTYPAIEFLDRIVQPSWRVLEWGCGASTRWWASRVRSVLAIEHQADWAAAVAAGLPDNAQVLHRPEPEGYLAAASEADGPLDVIVIDGEQRPACAAMAPARLAPGGIIVFDNSDRRSNATALRDLAEVGFLRIDFYGLAPCYLYKNCTSVLFRDAAILALQRPPSEPSGLLGPTVAQALGE